MSINTATGEITDADGYTINTLEELETTIEQGLHTFVEVGQALATIRDNRMYRDEFATFEAYCANRWNLSRTRAYDIISAAESAKAVSEISDITPNNEGQAKALRGMEPEAAADVMREAHRATNGNVTAKAIHEVRTSTAQDLAAGYVEKFPTLSYFHGKGEHTRVNSLGHDLAAMDAEEQARRLGILDKTIAYEKRKDVGETPRILHSVSATPPATALTIRQLVVLAESIDSLGANVLELAGDIDLDDHMPAIEKAARFLNDLITAVEEF